MSLYFIQDIYAQISIHICVFVWYMKMGSGFSADADLLFLSERCKVSQSDSHANFFTT